MAVAHKILVSTYHRLSEGTLYDEARSDRQEARQEAWEKQRALAALERLGSTVTLSPVAEAAKGPFTSFPHRRSSSPFTDQDIG
jgi:transposase